MPQIGALPDANGTITVGIADWPSAQPVFLATSQAATDGVDATIRNIRSLRLESKVGEDGIIDEETRSIISDSKIMLPTLHKLAQSAPSVPTVPLVDCASPSSFESPQTDSSADSLFAAKSSTVSPSSSDLSLMSSPPSRGPWPWDEQTYSPPNYVHGDNSHSLSNGSGAFLHLVKTWTASSDEVNRGADGMANIDQSSSSEIESQLSKRGDSSTVNDPSPAPPLFATSKLTVGTSTPSHNTSTSRPPLGHMQSAPNPIPRSSTSRHSHLPSHAKSSRSARGADTDHWSPSGRPPFPHRTSWPPNDHAYPHAYPFAPNSQWISEPYTDTSSPSRPPSRFVSRPHRQPKPGIGASRRRSIPSSGSSSSSSSSYSVSYSGSSAIGISFPPSAFTSTLLPAQNHDNDPACTSFPHAPTSTAAAHSLPNTVPSHSSSPGSASHSGLLPSSSSPSPASPLDEVISLACLSNPHSEKFRVLLGQEKARVLAGPASSVSSSPGSSGERSRSHFCGQGVQGEKSLEGEDDAGEPSFAIDLRGAAPPIEWAHRSDLILDDMTGQWMDPIEVSAREDEEAIASVSSADIPLRDVGPFLPAEARRGSQGGRASLELGATRLDAVPDIGVSSPRRPSRPPLPADRGHIHKEWSPGPGDAQLQEKARVPDGDFAIPEDEDATPKAEKDLEVIAAARN